MNKIVEVFIIYITFLWLKEKIIIYIASKTQITLLNIKKLLISVFTKYLDFVDIFLKKLTTKLFKQLIINKHTINLKKYKQLLYKPIYNLKLAESETFKTYIKTNLVNRFI